MGLFTEYPGSRETEDQPDPNHHQFVFRFGVDASACEHEWRTVWPEVEAWAQENDITLKASGQCVMLHREQPNDQRAATAFKMRWC